jgi:hypothetical protein
MISGLSVPITSTASCTRYKCSDNEYGQPLVIGTMSGRIRYWNSWLRESAEHEQIYLSEQSPCSDKNRSRYRNSDNETLV